jgi:hypothetical protein
MDKKKLLKTLIFLMLFIFGLDFLGRTFYWYYTVWYFDIITHFLGGFWVALFFLYTFLLFDKKAGIFRILLGVLLIGILWEIFEYIVFNRIGGTPFDSFDTSLDIVMDMVGGVASMFYVYRRIFSRLLL